MSNSGLRELV
ncbi:hypothetical protein LINPERHAP1_LOCUS24456 [Linum perenne]